ncbi:hypothetical protein DL96DRAFT_1814616 [Flagelloscypha sp. PMI_526]|nr:hypothetical protein DL96DRAFT_1814616 [Flagelloscypha sp. PMI_526]
MSSKKSDNRKTVLIIGAGSGAVVARTLSQKVDDIDIVLVEPLPYKALLPATIRLTVTSEGNLESLDKAFIPLDKVFPPGRPGRFVQGQVVSLTKSGSGGEAQLASGRENFLGLPRPIAFPWFKGEEAVQAHIKTQRENIAAAKDIVVVGAGAIGVELSGELKHFWPEKNVTVVQGDKGVMNDRYPAKLKRAVEAKFKASGVKLILNDYVDDVEGPVEKVVTRNGKEIKADLVLSARGPKPNTALLHGSPFSSALTKSGTVKVKPTLQVEGFDNVFAIGDIIEWKEQKWL